MTTHNLNILFVIAKSRTNQRGLAPIFCRLTFNGKRKQFSIGLFTRPEAWNNKQQVVKPPDKQAEYINSELSLIKQKINKAFLMLKVKEMPFNVDDIYIIYKGGTPKAEYGVLEYFKQYLEKREKLIGTEITQSTWSKFVYIKNDVVAFIKCRYKKRDVLLANLDMQFLNDFEYYLKTEKKNQQITINKNLQRFKSVVRASMEDKLLDSYPFTQHKTKRVKKQVIYLDSEELKILESYKFRQLRLRQVRDMFVFCCYTGLAYQEMADLEKKHLVSGFDGNTWIKMVRRKTNGLVSVPLLPVANNILQKYQYKLPVVSNQKFNSYLKEIADIVGIEKRLTHHIARKTFATTILLYNDVPMEIVSELLGHSKISITQEHYAKVVQKKVGEQMTKLRKKMEE